MNATELLLTYSSLALQGILLAILVSKGLFRRLGWFFAYLAVNFLFGVALLLLQHRERTYFITYWSGDAIVTILAIMASFEIFRSVFHHFYNLKWFRAVFPATCITLVILGSARTLFSVARIASEDLLISQIFSLEITVYILQVGIFCLFLVLVQFFRLPWKQYNFGIALGFGVSAAGSLVAFMFRSEFGTKFGSIFRFVVPLTYTIGVAIWLLTFLWPVPKASTVATPALTPEAVVTELKQYTRTVKEILKR